MPEQNKAEVLQQEGLRSSEFQAAPEEFAKMEAARVQSALETVDSMVARGPQIASSEAGLRNEAKAKIAMLSRKLSDGVYALRGKRMNPERMEAFDSTDVTLVAHAVLDRYHGQVDQGQRVEYFGFNLDLSNPENARLLSAVQGKMQEWQNNNGKPSEADLEIMRQNQERVFGKTARSESSQAAAPQVEQTVYQTETVQPMDMPGVIKTEVTGEQPEPKVQTVEDREQADRALRQRLEFTKDESDSPNSDAYMNKLRARMNVHPDQNVRREARIEFDMRFQKMQQEKAAALDARNKAQVQAEYDKAKGKLAEIQQLRDQGRTAEADELELKTKRDYAVEGKSGTLHVADLQRRNEQRDEAREARINAEMLPLQKQITQLSREGHVDQALEMKKRIIAEKFHGDAAAYARYEATAINTLAAQERADIEKRKQGPAGGHFASQPQQAATSSEMMKDATPA